MKEAYLIIRALLRTEKGAVLAGARKYLFSVATSSNKIEIKKAIENLYKVKVQDVNTQRVAGKPKRVRRDLGYRPDWKKAVVTLKEGQKIDLA